MSDIPPTADFPTAEELASALPQYEIEERISVGEESAVYRARQPALDRSVMIRVMAEPALNAAPRLMERLRARARVVHPRIVAVYDFGRSISGHLYLVTEHVSGRVLSDLIQERQVPPKLAYSYALQVCDILSMLHEQGMKHGALNSRTVLVDQEGQLKITGVGMSIAPSGEISWLHESEASITGDITDLGALLHEMFGREPLPEDGRVSRNLPPAFGAVIRRCVQLETTRRLTSAAEVKEALMQALKTQQQGAAPKAASTPAADPPSAHAARPAPAQAPAARPAPVSAPAAPPPVSHAPAAPAAYAPPRYAPGRPPPPVVRPQPSFMKKLDDFLWACLRASLHLSVFLVAAVVMLIFYVMKDKIVLKDPNDPDSAREEAPMPGQMLGKLPEAPQLPQTPVAVPSSPITLPPPATAADPLASLKAEYRNAVQSEATAALDKVRLNELPFFQKELQRLQNGESVPDTDEPNLPVALKRLRDDYRSKKAALGK
ncbi:MAG: protein kinase [Verrucomicrobiota bacterium]